MSGLNKIFAYMRTENSGVPMLDDYPTTPFMRQPSSTIVNGKAVMEKTQAQLFNNYTLTGGLSVTYFVLHSNIYQLTSFSPQTAVEIDDQQRCLAAGCQHLLTLDCLWASE